MQKLRPIATALFIVVVNCGGTVEERPGNTAGTAGSGGATAGSGGATAGSGGEGGSGGTDTRACAFTQECSLSEKSCCGYCSEQPISEFVAMNGKYTNAFYEELCGGGPIACPDCITFYHPNYVARCNAGRCTESDVRSESISSCASDKDCVLRWGGQCCEACASTGYPEGSDLVAVNRYADFGEVGCSTPIPCDPCAAPPYPQEYLAECGPDAHCRVVGP